MNSLNPGIINTVKWLNENGFQTVDSGDGETHDFECDLDCAYVHISVSPENLVSETNRLYYLLSDNGVSLSEMDEDNINPTIQSSYNPLDGKAFISLFNVKF